jgi:transcription antitermination factor NusG
MSGAQPKRWLAVYTQPRWEKKVNRLLEAKQITAYCPMNLFYRKWSDRMKKVEEPLFKSYVFVQVTEAEQSAVRMTPGVINFVYWLGKPAVIKPNEIEAIRRFMNEFEAVETLSLRELQPGDHVIIDAGLMMNRKATVLKTDNRYAELAIESLGYLLRAKVDKSKLVLAKTGL